MSKKKTQKEPASEFETKSWFRYIFAIIIGLLVILYSVGVLWGYIPEERQIDAVHLAIIGIAVLGITLLLNPDLFRRLKRFETSAFNLELFEGTKRGSIMLISFKTLR